MVVLNQPNRTVFTPTYTSRSLLLLGGVYSLMTVVDSPFTLKRRRLTTIDPMDSDTAQAKLSAIKEEIRREIRVFETLTASVTPKEVSINDPTDKFYEFTAEDYYRTMSTKKEDKFLKTRKIRQAEEAARKSKITKTLIRVRFPDNCTLEATFHSSDTFQSLVDLLKKVVARPEIPSYIYTTPPKKQIKDMSLDFYSAGFIPGAIVYFSYDLPKGDNGAAADSGPFLREEIMSLRGLNLTPEPVERVESAPEPVTAPPPPTVQEHKPAEKKPVKPRWLKM